MAMINPEWREPELMGWNNVMNRPRPLYMGWRKPRLYVEDGLWQCSLKVTNAFSRTTMNLVGRGMTQNQAWRCMVMMLHSTGGILP